MITCVTKILQFFRKTNKQTKFFFLSILLHYNLLISGCIAKMMEWYRTTDLHITFIIIAQHEICLMIKRKLHPGQKQPHDTPNLFWLFYEYVLILAPSHDNYFLR